MTRFKKFKRAKKNPFFFKILILGISVFFLVLLVNANFKINQERTELNEKIKFLENEIEKSYQERELLRRKISQVRTDDYLEEIAREELNLQREGEKVVAFPIIKEKKEDKQEIVREKNFWQKILEGLKIK
ncbi:MAG: septum formation initiator family protein [Patescibacteria group bacterium]|nr:septum formation initiator family protein [Patescibacteria group bacterium]